MRSLDEQLPFAKADSRYKMMAVLLTSLFGDGNLTGCRFYYS